MSAIRVRILLFFCLTVLPGLSAAQSSELIHYLGTLERLQVSMIVEDKDGLVIFEHNAHKVVPSASVIKIPILVELMVQAQALEINLEDEYLLKEEDIVGGSGELQHLTPGHELTIKELAVEMIRVSDNTATNVLINKLGFDRINQLLEANGFTNTQLERLMMDFHAIKEGRQNYTSASEMNRLLRMILTSEILKPEFSQKALEILLKCEDSSTIPSQLPAGVRVAHKTGALDYVRGDAGIIMGDEPVILTIFVENFRNLEQAEGVIGDLSRIAYREMAE